MSSMVFPYLYLITTYLYLITIYKIRLMFNTQCIHIPQYETIKYKLIGIRNLYYFCNVYSVYYFILKFVATV